MIVSVVIPSRLAAIDPAAPEGPRYLDRALAAVQSQSLLATPGARLQVVVGVDPGMGEAARARLPAGVEVAEAAAPSQADALNAALAEVRGDLVAFLEDDDSWSPGFLAQAHALLEHCGFVSSTQLEVTPAGEVLRIFDMATPSGWVMPRATLERVGRFDPSFRWHLDNEWLGRLGECGLARVHLVEATAPLRAQDIMQSRPQLAALIEHGRRVALSRHGSPWPLVLRTCHPGSGMARIATDAGVGAASRAEYQRLTERYGRIPN